MRYTGYGRGWQEEKATTRVARFFQVMREPATTNSYYAAAVCSALAVIAVATLFTVFAS